ncbi:hypothetical protein CMT41_08895 [Colwellia sp. MT41]|uniref:DUF7281 domain-containing protein n=1 Tax=Colwellia sp. MT41 TaxID=58049 RepID=UPI00071776DB|nr:hypothetical protein [Colwellia sp. MT41]ALO34820.1 hypothetical protein CMT41_08895 [Colwellia sp. MT41]
MNKQLYNFTQDKLQKNRQGGQIKNSALAIRLHKDYHFGQFDLSKKHLTFNLTDILALSKEIQRTLGVEIRNDSYPNKTSRVTNAGVNRSEKENSYAVSKDFILINSLSDLKINKTIYKSSPFTSLGNYIKADEIQSVEHSVIVLVENLAVMANLKLINLTALCDEIDLPIDLTKALWLYRGDVKPQQTTNTSYQFFRRFKGKIPLICFSDLDPKGIEIALTSQADFWLTLKNTHEVAMALLGSEQEWYKQKSAIDFLLKQEKTNEEKQPWQYSFDILQHHKKTLKQEHMLKHKLELALLKINDK